MINEMGIYKNIFDQTSGALSGQSEVNYLNFVELQSKFS